MNQLSHERSLKLDAFDRCDDLQRQVVVNMIPLIPLPLSSKLYSMLKAYFYYILANFYIKEKKRCSMFNKT